MAKNPLANDVAALAQRRGWKVASAESLTSGLLASTLGAEPGASGWFCGGVVAYSEEMKFDVLGVERGPVVSASCASQMAEGAARLAHADIAVAVTGVGGPDPQEDQSAGTVFIAVHARGTSRATEHHFPGMPEQVVALTVDQALRELILGLGGE